MRISKELYIGSGVDAPGTVLYALRRDLPLLNVYCLCMEEGSGRMVLLPQRELVAARSQKDWLVFGFAQGKKEAYGLFTEIVGEAASAGRPVEQLADYLKSQGVEAE